MQSLHIFFGLFTNINYWEREGHISPLDLWLCPRSHADLCFTGGDTFSSLMSLPFDPLLSTSFLAHALHSSASAASFSIPGLSQPAWERKGCSEDFASLLSLNLRAWGLEQGRQALDILSSTHSSERECRTKGGHGWGPCSQQSLNIWVSPETLMMGSRLLIPCSGLEVAQKTFCPHGPFLQSVLYLLSLLCPDRDPYQPPRPSAVVPGYPGPLGSSCLDHSFSRSQAGPHRS